MEVREVFEYISKNEGILIEEVAKKLGVAKSTLYYSINKNKLSHKLRKNLEKVYPKYFELIARGVDNADTYEGDNVFEKMTAFVIMNEKELLKIPRFRLWLKTKVQDGVIEVLSVKK